MSSNLYRLAAARHEYILQMLEKQNNITTSEICSALNISSVTVRNDLKTLEKAGKLQRVRGGATNIGTQATIIAIPHLRHQVNLKAKRVIAQLAASRVNDGDSLFIDSGTTTLELLRSLSGKHNLTIITNDIDILGEADNILSDSTFIMLGGTYRARNRLTYGSTPINTMRSMNADSAFICPASYLYDYGCMTEHESSASVKQALIEHARNSYLLLDTSKIGRRSFIGFAKLHEFNEVFLECNPGDDFLALAHEAGVQVTFDPDYA